MCGFVALFEHGRVFPEALLSAFSDDLFHRGPDSGGAVSAPGMALVFRRLAIMDPEAAANQPMTDPSRRFTLVFNGEIYNFQALKRDLEKEGATFSTHGDTEVLLAGWARWGERLLEKLEGMYAFVVVDRRDGMVYAARDPLGIKPLYMARTANRIGFASEMRPLRRAFASAPDPAAISELLVFRFAAGRLSNLKGVERVPGGTLVSFPMEDPTRLKVRKFEDALATIAPDAQGDLEMSLERIDGVLEASVSDHLQSDVGYALQLSGGVDSSLVAALSSRLSGKSIDSFGIHLEGLDEDESEWRELVCARYPIRHHEISLTARDYADALPRAVRHMEGPVPHSGCPMLMMLCDHIRQVTPVVLTGEGADELFGGYWRYHVWRELRLQGLVAALVPGPAWGLLRRYQYLRRFAEGRDPAIYSSVQLDYQALFRAFPDFVPAPGYRGEVASRFSDFRTRMLAVDQASYLESLLLRQDKMAMAASVEARVPFTHLPVFRAVNALPDSVRFFNEDTKPFLKRLAERYLPHELLYRRKVGLSLPLKTWLRDENSIGRYLDLLEAPDSRLAAMGQGQLLRQAIASVRAGGATALPLEHLINVELWLRDVDAPLPGPRLEEL